MNIFGSHSPWSRSPFLGRAELATMYAHGGQAARRHPRPYRPEGTPPYFGEWAVYGVGHGQVGPFMSIQAAFDAAAAAAGENGANSLPTDGFAQVKDSYGQSVGPIT